jgi:phosphatidylglycerophosphate synthase
MAAQPAHHIREHLSLLADAERRALIWIAGRLPARIHSDHLSALALLSMLAAGVSFAGFRVTPWAALGVIVSLLANWFGDSLDGTVARVRGQQRPRYGFYVDHVIDLAGTALLIAGLACTCSSPPSRT